MKLELVEGAAGSGKTSFLLDMVEEQIKAGIPTDKIGFLSFSKKAAEEAKKRAMAKFNLPAKAFPWFRTIHSFCFGALGIRKGEVVSRKHYQELGDILGISITGRVGLGDDNYSSSNQGDKLVFLEGLARNTKRSLRETWEEADDPQVDYGTLDWFEQSYSAYKQSKVLVDFNDMLQNYYMNGATIPLDFLAFDEAQDQSSLQWDVAKKIMSHAERVVVAGDCDQAIYRWSGADVDQYLALDGPRTILAKSHRLPRQILGVARSIIERCEHRIHKDFQHNGSEGIVEYHGQLEDVDMSEGKWLVLVRNGYLIREVEEFVRLQGYSYNTMFRPNVRPDSLKAILAYEHYRKGKGPLSDADRLLVKRFMPKAPLINGPVWHQAFTLMNMAEAEYYLAARRRGESFVNEPRIHISTIHAAKGGECDNVLLLTDMAKRSYDAMMKNMDDELRTQYVATSRAKKSLHIVLGRTNKFFEV